MKQYNTDMTQNARRNAQELIQPDEFLIGHMNSLILSPDMNDHIGAAIAAEYLTRGDIENRESDNLKACTANYASLTVAADKLECATQDKNITDRERLQARLVLKLAPLTLGTERGYALAALAAYKINHGYTKTESEAITDFKLALDNGSRIGRFIIRNSWLRGYAQEWINQAEPSERALLGAAAVLSLSKPRNPARKFDYWLDKRKLGKKQKELEATV